MDSVYQQIKSIGHDLGHFHIQKSGTSPFCENYEKIYFDAKYVENGLNRGAVKLLMPFLVNIGHCPNFLD